MRARTDFVSNSSSSSVIVLAEAGTSVAADVERRWRGQTFRYPDVRWKCDFDWGFVDTRSFEGKMNFLGIQLIYLHHMEADHLEGGYTERWNFDRCRDLVERVCRRNGVAVELNLHPGPGLDWEDEGYWPETDPDGELEELDALIGIDHQSAVTEGRCMEAFESEDAMERFLFLDQSLVQGGNDNSDRPEGRFVEQA